LMTNTTGLGDDGAAAPMVGDHPALDLLNTEARRQGGIVDYWTSDEDVLRWLERQGVAPPPEGKRRKSPAGLLTQARELRAVARTLVMARKQGKAATTGGLNAYLHAHVSAPHLHVDGKGGFTLEREPRGDALATLLGPLAESVARLLVEGDFDMVRKCEHPDCVLWFYDRTRSHKRRWCSMAACGNRYKAARFRERRSDSGA